MLFTSLETYFVANNPRKCAKKSFPFIIRQVNRGAATGNGQKIYLINQCYFLQFAIKDNITWHPSSYSATNGSELKGALNPNFLNLTINRENFWL